MYFSMKKILAILSTAVLLFSACDKIEPGENGEYTVFSGSVATWTDGTMPSETVQRAMVEKYTGPKCVNCPLADQILNETHGRIGDRMVIYSINPSGGDGEHFDGQPDVSTADGDQWAIAFGGSVNMTLPQAMVNRDTLFSGAASMTGVEDIVNTTIAQEAQIAVEVTAATAANGKTGIDVTIGFLQTINESLTLTLVLTEDSLMYMQAPNPSQLYRHDHMLRDVITDVWGLKIEADGRAGEARTAHFNYSLPDGVVKENCHIVAFVSYKDSRLVINCDECKIDE